MTDTSTVDAVRSFNRSWTRLAGLLRAGLLDTPHSLTEARVIFELAQRSAIDLAELRQILDLDAGFATRVVKRLTSAGLVVVQSSPDDGRRKQLALTDAGRQAYDELDARADEQVGALLAPVAMADRPRLVEAMATVRTILDAQTVGPSTIRALRPGDLGWVVERHGAIYYTEYGWDHRFEGLVARVVADYVDDHDPARASAWIAERDGVRVGSVFCTQKDPRTAQLRLLLVEPHARGTGVGQELVSRCIAFARDAGYRRMTLWTNDVLVAARRIYEAHGFVLVDEHRHTSFGHELVGQNWWLELDEWTGTA